MTVTQQGRLSRRKIVGATIGVIAVIAVTAVLVVVVQLSAAVARKQEPTVTPSNSPALEDQLRPKGPAEDALTRYESALHATADDLTKLVPDLTWQWNRDVKYLDCSGDFADTRGVRVITRNLVSNRYQTTPGRRSLKSFATTPLRLAPHNSMFMPTSQAIMTSPSMPTTAWSCNL
jgi:Lipoprotein confined to pathogenic Mycobacterium